MIIINRLVHRVSKTIGVRNDHQNVHRAWKTKDHKSKVLVFVHFGHMTALSIFALECLLTIVTIVAEKTREVNTLNVVLDITIVCVLLSTQGAPKAWPPIFKHCPLHVLVKHFPIDRSSWKKTCYMLKIFDRLSKALRLYAKHWLLFCLGVISRKSPVWRYPSHEKGGGSIKKKC